MAFPFRSKTLATLALGAAALLGAAAAPAPASAADADNTSRSGPAVAAPRAAAITGYFAVVDGNGFFQRGKGVIRASRLLTGSYEVIFVGDIRRCAFTGSLGNVGFVGSAASGEIDVQGRFGTTNGVFVNTANPSGVLADRPFHVVVTCP